MEDITYGGLSMFNKTLKIVPTNFVLDLDGVFTDGKFYYSQDGKYMKVFGPDDHDCINVLKQFMKIHVVTADLKGYEISKRRIELDMGLEIDLVSAVDRTEWMAKKFNLGKTIYMGDGILDYLVFNKVFYSIAPANALRSTKNKASFATTNSGGERAVAEACLHILNKFFPTQIHNLF
jgi:3-deoxy-D-manno-octulosonate 8-phosphate phosphatase (KDO 8-P phosphatase)